MKGNLEISENSWHYKMNDWYSFQYNATNLCAYIRWSLVSIALTAFIAVVVFFIAWLLLISPAIMFNHFVFDWMVGGIPPEIALISLALDACIILGLVYGFGIEPYKEKHIHDGSVFTKGPLSVNISTDIIPQDSFLRLLVAWMTAKHDKICPLIDYRSPVNKDNEQNNSD